MAAGLFSHFRTRLFVTYLIIIVVGFLVLGVALDLALPSALGRHMGRGMDGMQMGGAGGPENDLLQNSRAALNEAFLIALAAAFFIALIFSNWMSRQLSTPLSELSAASQEIAAGRYEKRVKTHGDPQETDVDELGRLAHSFNHMANELEQTENLRRQLIGDVSHELRTPLTAIKGYSEGLVDGVLPANAETYQQIHKEAERMQRLVADLQELSLVQSSGFELEKRKVPVGALLGSVKKKLGKQFKDKGVDFEIHMPVIKLTIFGDEYRIEQVLVNLLSNALQYTSAGGKVQCSAAPQDAHVIFKISDTGIGIPTKNLPHIFDRFYRVDKSRSRAGGGSGIGLTIAKHLVEAHEGRIWAESQGSGEGSTFSFTLPVVAK